LLQIPTNFLAMRATNLACNKQSSKAFEIALQSAAVIGFC
jgi:hypothetical protein